MGKSGFTEAQIVGMIKEREAGLPTSERCRKHGLSLATFYKLKAKYGEMDLSDEKRLKQLEDENLKLMRLLANAMLDNVVLKDPLENLDNADDAAGDEGSSDLSPPGLRPDRCRS
jgi:putative transposase